MKSTRIRRMVCGIVAAVTAIAMTGCTISSTPSEPGKTTLTVWQYYAPGPQLDWLKAQAKAFERRHPDVLVDLVQVVGSQQDQKLLTSVPTNRMPDLFINNIVVDFPTLVAGGVLKDLTPYWDDFAGRDQFPEAAVWRDDGRVYNVLQYTNLVGLYYNEDILKASGIDGPPQTMDELTADLAKVQAGGKYKGIALSGAASVEGAWLFAPQLLGAGAGYCRFQGAAVEQAYDRWNTWARKGYLPIAAATWDQNAAWQQFSTGKYAFAINGNWQLGSVKDAGFAYGTAQYPAPTGGKSVVFPGGEGWGIGAKAQHPDLAWQFLEEMILSERGGEGAYTSAGSIPVREDSAQTPAIRDDPNVQPFVKAAQSSGQWPNNENTAQMQTALGESVSAVISGQQSPAQAMRSAQQAIAAARQDGGGGC